MSARLMQSGVGTVALVVAGVIVVAVGGYHVYEGASSNFLEDLKGKSGALAKRLGMFGYVGRA